MHKNILQFPETTKEGPLSMPPTSCLDLRKNTNLFLARWSRVEQREFFRQLVVGVSGLQSGFRPSEDNKVLISQHL